MWFEEKNVSGSNLAKTKKEEGKVIESRIFHSELSQLRH
jgi:hypothetical protein